MRGLQVRSRPKDVLDPYSVFPSFTRRKLRTVYDWIDDCDRKPTRGSGVVFSMTDKQIVATGTRLVEARRGQKPRRQGSGDGNSGVVETNETMVVRGSTLVVATTKEELGEWEKALRERTGASVVNHSAIQLSRRCRPEAAHHFAAFDVVLTTYDAIIRKEVTLPLDKDGHVVHGLGFENGWYSSRSTSQEDRPDRCTHLTTLHLVQWRRILFVDSLGRKSYLAKSNTLRHRAAVAFGSDSLFIFFGLSTDTDVAQLEELKRSNKKALSSVASVLRLGDKSTSEIVLHCRDLQEDL